MSAYMSALGISLFTIFEVLHPFLLLPELPDSPTLANAILPDACNSKPYKILTMPLADVSFSPFLACLSFHALNPKSNIKTHPQSLSHCYTWAYLPTDLFILSRHPKHSYDLGTKEVIPPPIHQPHVPLPAQILQLYRINPIISALAHDTLSGQHFLYPGVAQLHLRVLRGRGGLHIHCSDMKMKVGDRWMASDHDDFGCFGRLMTLHPLHLGDDKEP